MSKANEKIFSSLIAFADKKEVEVKNAREIRFIQSNESEKEIIKYLNIGYREKISRTIEFAIVFFKEEMYLVIVGPEIPEENIGDFFEFVPMNAGWFTAIASEMQVSIPSGMSAHQVADTLNERYKDAENLYEGHSYSELSIFFYSIYVFSVSSGSPFKKGDIYRIIGTFLCSRQELLSLDISQQLLREYEKLFIEGTDNIPFEEILGGLTSLRHKDTFLYLYRCIERLFPYSYIKSLHNKIMPNKNIEELIGIVETSLSWKPKEELAIELIFSKYEQIEEGLFFDIKHKLFGSREGKIGSQFIYLLRNSIVHHRLNSKQTLKELSVPDWESLARGMLIVVRNEYRQYC
ncbi:MAG: hypothetical protein ACTFAK_10565 [Candidatus Electronema sp. VV]